MGQETTRTGRASTYKSSNPVRQSRPPLSLYSFRHAFQHALAKAGHGNEVKKALMGHAEGGMTARYGTKNRPREVNIQELDATVQGLRRPFLQAVLKG